MKKSVTQHNADLDYVLLMMMFEHGKTPYAGTGIEDKIAGPTTAILYRNLEPVMNGEWWFYSPQEYLTLVDYDERVRRLHGPSHDNIERQEALVLRDFLYFLAFDHVQYGKDRFGHVFGSKALPDDYVFKMLCHENEKFPSPSAKNKPLAWPCRPSALFASISATTTCPAICVARTVHSDNGKVRCSRSFVKSFTSYKNTHKQKSSKKNSIRYVSFSRTTALACTTYTYYTKERERECESDDAAIPLTLL